MKIGEYVEVSFTGMVTSVDHAGETRRLRISREGMMDSYVYESDVVVKEEFPDAEIARGGGAVCR